jgi:hypothetical protein
LAGWSPDGGPGRWCSGCWLTCPEKNCWTIAEHAGDATPDGLQHLLAGAVWDHDGVRDDVRDYLLEHLGDPAAVLVVDETGDLKKGASTVGVGRQYTGTAGKVDNAQVAVYLTYATAVVLLLRLVPRTRDGPAQVSARVLARRGAVCDRTACRRPPMAPRYPAADP